MGKKLYKNISKGQFNDNLNDPLNPGEIAYMEVTKMVKQSAASGWLSSDVSASEFKDSNLELAKKGHLRAAFRLGKEYREGKLVDAKVKTAKTIVSNETKS